MSLSFSALEFVLFENNFTHFEEMLELFFLIAWSTLTNALIDGFGQSRILISRYIKGDIIFLIVSDKLKREVSEISKEFWNSKINFLIWDSPLAFEADSINFVNAYKLKSVNY